VLVGVSTGLAACVSSVPTNPADLSYPSVSHLIIGAQSGCQHQDSPIGIVESIAVDGGGNIYVADVQSGQERIEKVSLDRRVSVFAGNNHNSGDVWQSRDEGRPATSVEIRANWVTLDNAGNLLISGYGRIFRVTSDGRIHVVAGSGMHFRFSGDGGPASRADLNDQSGLVVDPEGNVYIGDTNNFRVRRVSPSGRITTVAGNGVSGTVGDGGSAGSARLKSPQGLALDPAGNLYIADDVAVRKVTRDGLITTVAGNFAPANEGFGGQATNAALLAVRGIAFDKKGNLYIASATMQDGSTLPNQDGGLFVVTPDGVLHKIIAATDGYSSNEINNVAVDPQGNVYYSSECGIYHLGYN
jgi:sugar lactone lactonase YvrE